MIVLQCVVARRRLLILFAYNYIEHIAFTPFSCGFNFHLLPNLVTMELKTPTSAPVEYGCLTQGSSVTKVRGFDVIRRTTSLHFVLS